MEEGIFSGWLKKNGDLVRSGDLIFTLEGEKSAQDIESTDSGLLRIPDDSPEAGATVKVGQVIGHLLAENESPTSVGTPVKQSPEQPAETAAAEPKVAGRDGSVTAADGRDGFHNVGTAPISSPRARRRAAELGVEVEGLQGSGRTGRIIEADVVKAAASRTTPAINPTSAKSVAAAAGKISTMRRSIAERTALSFSQIPHFYLRAEVNATELVKTREHLVRVLEKECGVRITLTDFLLRAQAKALVEFPAANAVWQNDTVVSHADAEIGVVVGLPDGLLIPILRGAQNLSFIQLAKERARLVAAVRAGRFDTEMLAGGATSISNLGTGRTDEFAAIIPPHQSSILAVGRAAARPYVVDGQLEVCTTLRLCLSVDHRVMDGGPAADFLGRIVELLETPDALVNGN